MRVKSTLTTLFRFGNKVCFENNKRMRGEIIGFFIIKQIKEASTVLCSVIKHAGSDKSTQEVLNTLACGSCFPTSLVLSSFPACFIRNRARLRLFFIC